MLIERKTKTEATYRDDSISYSPLSGPARKLAAGRARSPRRPPSLAAALELCGPAPARHVQELVGELALLHAAPAVAAHVVQQLAEGLGRLGEQHLACAGLHEVEGLALGLLLQLLLLLSLFILQLVSLVIIVIVMMMMINILASLNLRAWRLCFRLAWAVRGFAPAAAAAPGPGCAAGCLWAALLV